MEILKNDQLYVNSKWYMDVIDIVNNLVTVRVKYSEAIDKGPYIYKNIKIPLEVIKPTEEKNGIKYCKINEIDLKKIIGGLIYRLHKQNDINAILEDGANAANTAGMGAVSFGTMSGTPGVPGGAGSGDIAGTVKFASTKAGTGTLPGNEFGLQIHPKVNAKIRKKIKTKAGKAIVKQPVINLSENADVETESDVEYKTKLFDFLDYPTDNEYDIKIIKIITTHRPEFLTMSSDRIKLYLNDLYTLNLTLITNHCSDWLKNNIFVLADVKTEE